ncbi:MAG: hypothetical protein H0U18_02640 [Pyrinomonadaceae bacterium]|nr:hypothetical protein [Pyrinomonadaceae bacterium]
MQAIPEQKTYKVTNHGGRQSELGIYSATNNRESNRRYGVYDEKRPERGSERIQLSGFHKQKDDEVTDHSRAAASLCQDFLVVPNELFFLKLCE